MNHFFHFIMQEVRTTWSNFTTYEEEFLATIIKKNAFIIFLGALLNCCTQLFNLYRVLFLSTSKLHSVNNQIYFTFYLVLFLVSLTALVLHSRWPKTLVKIYYLQLFYYFFYIYWNLLLNSYTLYGNPGSSTIVYITAVIFTTILFRFKLNHILMIQLLSYLPFLLLNYGTIQSGDIINMSISIIATLLCATILFAVEIRLLYNQHTLLHINEELKTREDALRLELEKHQVIMAETNLFSFDWNLLDHTLTPSRNCSEILGWPPYIEHPRQWITETDVIFPADCQNTLDLIQKAIHGNTCENIDLRIRDYTNNYTWYRLQLFVQYNQNQIATTVIGTLLNIDGTTKLINNLNKQLHTQLEGSKQYIEQLKDAQEQTIIYRHDMRHSLKLMEQLAYQGNMEKLSSYLTEIHSKLDSITPNHYCENETINLILGSFDQLARKQAISFATNIIVPQDLPISDTEVCSLLFNLLENAMTAASQPEDSSLRYVHMKSAYKDKKWILFIENGFSGDIVMEDDLPISQSKHEGHGLGIKSIINIVDNHDGLYTFEVDGQKFYTKILLAI